VLDGALVGDGACVVAIGSHSPTGRELPTSLVVRAFVVVEERAAALREAGDVCVPIAEGAVTEAVIAADLGQLVRGEIAPVDGAPRVFKSVGLAWEDAVVSRMLVARAERADEGGTR
jgi:ornithine cyclodeaminase